MSRTHDEDDFECPKCPGNLNEWLGLNQAMSVLMLGQQYEFYRRNPPLAIQATRKPADPIGTAATEADAAPAVQDHQQAEIRPNFGHAARKADMLRTYERTAAIASFGRA
jgi:hypothetical protein